MKRILLCLLVLVVMLCGCMQLDQTAITEDPELGRVEELLPVMAMSVDNELMHEYLNNISQFENLTQEFGETSSYIKMDEKLVACVLYPYTEVKIIDDTIKAWIDETVSEFCDELADIENLSEPAELNVTYESCYARENIVSIKISGTYFASYLAHPVDVVKTVCADLATGTLLDFASVFGIRDVNSLSAVAEILGTECDMGIVDDFYMTKTGVEIILPRGKYLPMSEGTKKLFFEYVDLTDLLGIEMWETVESEAPTEAVRDLLKEIEIISASRPDIVPVDPNKPLIALTFDDGPSRHTERLLDIFKEHGGRGTFYVVGNLIDARSEMIKRIYMEGHEIGNHSWSHRQLTKLDESEVVDQIMMTKAKIYDITGFDCKTVRPPYGSYNEETLKIAEELGVSFVNWSVDTLDWQSKDAKAVYDEIVGIAKDGDIVLCHDLHETTVDAMETVIPKLIEDGYQLVTVSQLLSRAGEEPEAGKVYRKNTQKTVALGDVATEN